MKYQLKLFCLLLSFTSFFRVSNTFFLDWIVPSASRENVGTEIEAVPAPVKTKEDRFLEEAKEHIKMSPLDICQHKIILKLKSSCSVLSEEALLKMSVSLLNCQSKVEGRKQIQCTEEMTLKECTKAMDPGIWNLYHLMSIRAKSVCYLTRQQQFNAYTDMMLSRLTSAAQDQTATMMLLEEGQEKLQVMARETLDFLKNAQERLKIKETETTAQLKKLDDAISANMEAVKAQEELLVEAQSQLSVYVDNIKSAFDSSEQRNVNRTRIEKLHVAILSMLSTFKTESEARWKKFETSFAESDVILQKINLQKEELSYKANYIRNITKSVVAYFTDVVNNVLFSLSWLFCFTCKADDHEAQVWCYVQHVLLAVANVVLWLLIRLDFRILVLITYCNFMIYYWRVNDSPKPSSLTMEIFLFIIGQYLFLKVCQFLIAAKRILSAAISSGNVRNLMIFLLRGHSMKNIKLHQPGHGIRRGLRCPTRERAVRNSRSPIPSVTLQHLRSSVSSHPLQHSRSPTPSHDFQHSRSPTSARWPLPSTSDSTVHLRSSTPLRTGAGFSSSQVSAQSRWPHLLTSVPSTSATDFSTSYVSTQSNRTPSSSSSYSLNRRFISTPLSTKTGPSTYRGYTPPSYSTNRDQEVLSPPKSLCKAACKTGKLCRNPVMAGEELCYRHLH